MKRQWTALLAIPFLVLSLTGCSMDTGNDGGAMRSDLSAMEYAKEMGVGLNLGNTFEAYWEDSKDMTAGASTIGDDTPQDYETCWGAVVTTPECIKGIRDAGFQTVRVPVYWGNMMKDDGKYTINTEYMDRIQEIVDECRSNDLYVVINVHHYDEFLIKNHTQEETLAAVETIWTQIAKRFKGYSDYLVFEGFNEALGTPQNGTTMTEEETYAYVNAMNQTFVDAVRKTGGNNQDRLLIASGYWTNIDNTTKDLFVMPEDSAEDKLMVSVHYIDNACFWTNQVGTQHWYDYSVQQCELLKEAFIDQEIPVFVGECTAIYDDEHRSASSIYGESSDCLHILLDMATEYELVPVLWDVSEGFYSRLQCRIQEDANAQVITEIAEKIAEE